MLYKVVLPEVFLPDVTLIDPVNGPQVIHSHLHPELAKVFPTKSTHIDGIQEWSYEAVYIGHAITRPPLHLYMFVAYMSVQFVAELVPSGTVCTLVWLRLHVTSIVHSQQGKVIVRSHTWTYIKSSVMANDLPRAQQVHL